MGRPAKAVKLDRAAKEAEDAIRAKLPDLTNLLLKHAIEATEAVRCPHCKKQFELTREGDTKVALALIERVMGKPSQRTPDAPATQIQDLLTRLADVGAAGTSPNTTLEAAEKAKERAERRAALKVGFANAAGLN